MTAHLQPGKLVSLRGREWVVLPSDDPDLLMVKPLGGSEEETTGIYLPLQIPSDKPVDARFAPPQAVDLGDFATARLLYDSARLAFRNGAGPFRALAKLSFRPRAYQIVPLIMALRQETVRLLIADDVGVGKTVEALLIVRELLERKKIQRFAVVCLPHLCDQWQEEIRSKLDIEAVIIRSNTQARLDREIQGDTSVYDFYPYQIISIDFIKSDVRREVFIEQCPELLIVDEAHTATKPAGASATQQQRYDLVRRIAARRDQNLILMTATPHSGKPEEFHSLLGLLLPEFENMDLPHSSRSEREHLAKHVLQRKRADVAKNWPGGDTPFPERDPIEWSYDLSPKYEAFFDDVLEFVRNLVKGEDQGARTARVHYWTALGLLRGVMSSPAAGVKMFNQRLEKLGLPHEGDADIGEDSENPIRDLDYGFEGDNTPTQVVEHVDWGEHQRRRLRDFGLRLASLGNFEDDQKLYAAAIILQEWLHKGFNPVIFCRYIETAKYVGEHLGDELRKHFPSSDIQVVTSEDPDDVRKERIAGMRKFKLRVLVATDCLSEGINLQELFTAVLHYDLPWNPNRLEQREGRVDRFGQEASEVKACLLYGADNQIDGIVLDVLLRKVREIKKSTGINVPFPEDSQSIIDTITKALLLNPDRRVKQRRAEQKLLFDFDEFGEAAAAKANVTRKVDEAAEREKASRSIFAHHAIKAHEIEEDLSAVDEAIGDPTAVQTFVISALQNLFGVQVTTERRGFGIVTGNLPLQLVDLLPRGAHVKVSFESPMPEGYHYLGRNHRFVEQLCQLVMANTLARQDRRAARAAVIRTREVPRKTTLLLFRCRNVIEQGREGGNQIVAEEMLLWGWRGTPTEREFLSHEEAKRLMATARASSNLSPESRANFLNNELQTLESLREQFDTIAEEQAKKLVAAHERFSALMDRQRFQVVYPVLPMDLLGIYVLLPEVPA